MLCIHLQNNDPNFCLAAEEYLLRTFEEDIFMLWQSHDTVVVGKHQNLMGEVNYPYCLEKDITIARRISGGGTVFHDTGNVNFSYIKNVNSPSEVSFRMFTEPVVEALARLGIRAETSGRNDLLVDGKKISGNAEHIYKNRVLHHGTLLFNSDLKNLGQAIKVVPGKYQSKAVQSNRSEVANIAPSLKTEMDITGFIKFLLNVQLEKAENTFYKLTRQDTEQIEKLVSEKFTNWDWIYGYSPAYSFQNKFKSDGKVLEIELQVKKGIIQECKISGDYFDSRQTGKLNTSLIGEKHDFTSLKNILIQLHFDVGLKLIESFF